MSNVFVSYAHADRARVEPMIAQLQQQALDVWWDKHLPLGRNWDEQLEQAMAQAPTILVVWSAAARASDEVKDEAYFARKLGKALPARIEPVELPYRLDRIQRVELLTDPVQECPDWPALVEALRQGRGMVFVDERGLQAGARPGLAAPRRAAVAAGWTPVCVIAGLAIAGFGQVAGDAQAQFALVVGSLLCGGGLVGALMAYAADRR